MRADESSRVVMLGALNTDIVVDGVDTATPAGRPAYGKGVSIRPGGKARNAAEMAAHLTGPGAVAMIGRTARDPHGLWRVPVDALETADVDTAHIVVEESGRPGTVVIIAGSDGDSHEYAVEGATTDFSPEDVTAAAPLFDPGEQDGRVLGVSLEPPVATVRQAIDLADQNDMRIVVDPGGLRSEDDYSDILDREIFLVKPNEDEAERLTGVTVAGRDGARDAAAALRGRGPENVLITLGADGAVLATPNGSRHIPAPTIDGSDTHGTGCGDQVFGTMCALLAAGIAIEDAAAAAVTAGTLQFHQHGRDPVGRDEIAARHGFLD